MKTEGKKISNIRNNRIYKWATKKDYAFNQSPIDNLFAIWQAIFLAIIAMSPLILIIWLIGLYVK